MQASQDTISVLTWMAFMFSQKLRTPQQHCKMTGGVAAMRRRSRQSSKIGETLFPFQREFMRKILIENLSSVNFSTLKRRNTSYVFGMEFKTAHIASRNHLKACRGRFRVFQTEKGLQNNI